MPSLHLKLIALLLLIFTAAMLLIRAQPYDDQRVRALLIPAGCAMPCFMGIRPGVTTIDEAAMVLQTSGWVDTASIVTRTRFNIVRLEWNWNGLQPVTVDGDAGGVAVATIMPGFNEDTTLNEQDRVITGLSIVTTIPYGDARLILGRGEDKPDYVVSGSYFNPRITAAYSDDKLVVLSTLMRCPVSLGDFWNKTVMLQIGYTFIDDLVHVCRGGSWG